MEYRTLGSTGLKVSAIGFGGFGIGGGYLMQDKSVALRAIGHAFELGINFFDTAPFAYNDSEQLLGKALKGRRDKVIIATKAENLGDHSVRSCVETSLRQLQADYLDILQFRDPSAEGLDHHRFQEVCAELQSEGKIRFAAVTVGDSQQMPQALLGMERGFSIIQLAYNIIFDVAEEVVLPEAKRKGIGIVARGPLCKGFLADRLMTKPGEISAHPNFRWFTEEEGETLLRLQKELSFLVIEGKRSMAQAALRFVLQNPAISTTIPSLETPEDVDQMVAALDVPALTESEIERAKAIVRSLPAIDY